MPIGIMRRNPGSLLTALASLQCERTPSPPSAFSIRGAGLSSAQLGEFSQPVGVCDSED